MAGFAERGAVTWVQALEPPDNLDRGDRYRQGRAATVVPALLAELARELGIRLPSAPSTP